MKPSWRRHIVVVWATALALALVACSHNTTKAQDPPKPHITSSVSSSAPSSLPSPTPAAEKDAAARSAADAAWLRYWDVEGSIATQYPQAQWPTVVSSVSADPIKSQLVKALNADKIIDVVTYGKIIHHVYSTALVSQKAAHVGDCMDGSHYGSMFRKTGKKRTVGPPKNNTVGSLVLGSDGKWRVATIAYLTDKPC